jgi:cytochrome P450
MRACLYFTAQNPDVYKRLREEVDQYYNQHNLEHPINYKETQELPFLKAVVKEATRVLPSIVFQLLRHAPPDFSVRGHKVPQGTPVGISPIAQNHDEDIFGPDADVFRPERWLEDPTRAKYMDTCLMTFGGNGPRVCVGRNIALVSQSCFHSPSLNRDHAGLLTNGIHSSRCTNSSPSSFDISISRLWTRRSRGGLRRIGLRISMILT